MHQLVKATASMPSRFNNLTVPLINTSPINDLGILIALFPLWWFFGIEQFVWVIGLTAIGIKVIVIQQQKVRIVGTLKWLFVFLIIHLLSGLFIVESFRWITFFRNFGTYVAAFLVVFIITNQLKSWRQIKWILAIMTVVFLIATTVGLLGIIGIWQPSFTSLMGSVLPGWIRNTSYGGQISFRSTGRLSWFAGLNVYFRVYSLFMFSTLYASALTQFLPMMFFQFSQSSKLRKKVFLAITGILIVFNLVFTTGRIAIISCLVGAGYYLIFYSKWRTVIRLLSLLAIIGTILLVFVSAYSTSNIFSLVSKLYEDVLFARGPGSFTDRSAVYVYTLRGALERPLLGWGTERDIPNFPYPAGSHSHYLGILYKQGFIGFLVFMGTLFTLWKETSVPKLSRTATSVQRTLVKFLQFGRWTMVTALFNRASDVLDLDATTMMFLWTLFALLIQARSLIFSPYEEQKEQIANVPE